MTIRPAAERASGRRLTPAPRRSSMAKEPTMNTPACPRLLAVLVIVAAMTAALDTAGAGVARLATAQEPSPAQTLIGQQVETCKSGHTFTVEVVSAYLVTAVQGKPADGGMTWLIVIADVANTSSERGDLYMALKVRDDRGGDFPYRSPGSREEIDLGYEYEVQPSFQALDVGWSDRFVFTFQVPAGATAFTLLADKIHCD